MKPESDIIADTIREQTSVTLFEAQRIADLIRQRIEKAANVFGENTDEQPDHSDEVMDSFNEDSYEAPLAEQMEREARRNERPLPGD